MSKDRYDNMGYAAAVRAGRRKNSRPERGYSPSSPKETRRELRERGLVRVALDPSDYTLKRRLSANCQLAVRIEEKQYRTGEVLNEASAALIQAMKIEKGLFVVPQEDDGNDGPEPNETNPNPVTVRGVAQAAERVNRKEAAKREIYLKLNTLACRRCIAKKLELGQKESDLEGMCALSELAPKVLSHVVDIVMSNDK